MLRLRELTAEETAALKRLAHARTEAARAVERATIIWLASQGERVAAIARRLGLTEATVRLWLKRFNKEGLAGLADRPHAQVVAAPQRARDRHDPVQVVRREVAAGLRAARLRVALRHVGVRQPGGQAAEAPNARDVGNRLDVEDQDRRHANTPVDR